MSTPTSWKRVPTRLLLCAALALPAAQLTAQARPAPAASAGGVSGAVVDAGSGLPLSGATVSLEAEGVPAIPSGTGTSFLEGSRGVLSDSAGRYRFEGLPPGRYRLRISRVGYRPATVGVELRGAADSRVSVGLTVEPVSLEPVEVSALRSDPYARDAGVEGEIDGARVRAAQARQRAHLATDVRELTHADVLEAVTLGETDLFRALQRAPGVSARDDYGADFWVRGARWDQTRVYFDGLPLFNPVHGFGLLSAVNTDAVGGALLHPGVRSAALGDAAAGVVEVSSRRGAGDGGINGIADLSLSSARLALDRTFLDGRGAWMLAGRRSWLDWATGGVGRAAGDPDLHLPYSFSDLTGRFDLRLDQRRAVEVSGLWERDRVAGDLPDVLHRTDARWGNAAGRVAFAAPLGGYDARHSLGVSRYAAHTRELPADPGREDRYSAPGEQESDNELLHLSLSGELTPSVVSGRVLPWRLGYGVVRQSGSYRGPHAYAYNGYRALDADSVLRRDAGLGYAVLWGERRWTAGEALTVEAGLRLEGGSPVENGGVLRAAPRLSARFSPHPELALSAGLGRSFQYTQALAPTGPMLAPGNSASQLWILADDEAPAVRSDIGTLGGELWVSGDWLLGANAYLRRSTGVVLPDPTPGPLVGRPLFVRGDNTARGLELSARRLAGRWTASASYSYGVSEMEAAGLRFAAAEDRRHSLDLTSMVRAGGSLRLGGAFTAATGAPYTRYYQPYYSCGTEGAQCDGLLRAEAPNAQRTGAYASLDLLLDWTHGFRGWDLSAYLQLRNALGHDNSVTNTGTREQCVGRGYTSDCDTWFELTDQFQMGLPTIPVLGFRARF